MKNVNKKKLNVMSIQHKNDLHQLINYLIFFLRIKMVSQTLTIYMLEDKNDNYYVGSTI